MKVILLAGGFGTRLAEYTDVIPKPMVPVGGKPILWHIMQTYARFGHKDFYVALGYKAEVIKDYFLKYRALNADFTVDLASGNIKSHQVDSVDWKVTLVNTGDSSMTGGRVKRMQSFIGNETCMLTYGDGVCDVNIEELVKFHNKHGKIATVTAVRPPARFGVMKLDGDKVDYFHEKSQTDTGWINGGYFVCEPSIFDYIKNDDESIWEKDPLEKLANDGELNLNFHDGFWKPMDSLKDKVDLNEMWNTGKADWKIWK